MGSVRRLLGREGPELNQEHRVRPGEPGLKFRGQVHGLDKKRKRPGVQQCTADGRRVKR